MVIGEVKTATKASITWADGAKDILDYQKSIPEMFVPNILSFSSEGKELYYGSIGAPSSVKAYGRDFLGRFILDVITNCDEIRLHSNLIFDLPSLLSRS